MMGNIRTASDVLEEIMSGIAQGRTFSEQSELNREFMMLFVREVLEVSDFTLLCTDEVGHD